MEGINRNILECKDGIPGHAVKRRNSINRNILECKVLPEFVKSQTVPY